MTTIRAGAIIASSILLFGCAEETQRNKMEAALSPWVGRSIADYVLSRGPPTNTVNLGPNKRGFQWVLTGVAPGGVAPIGGALITVPPRQQTCTVSFEAETRSANPALADWTITNWRWNGAC